MLLQMAAYFYVILTVRALTKQQSRTIEIVRVLDEKVPSASVYGIH